MNKAGWVRPGSAHNFNPSRENQRRRHLIDLCLPHAAAGEIDPSPATNGPASPCCFALENEAERLLLSASESVGLSPATGGEGEGGRYGVGHRAGAEGEVAAVQGEGGVARVGVSEGRQYTRPRPSDALVDRHQHQGVDTARARGC